MIVRILSISIIHRFYIIIKQCPFSRLRKTYGMEKNMPAKKTAKKPAAKKAPAKKPAKKVVKKKK